VDDQHDSEIENRDHERSHVRWQAARNVVFEDLVKFVQDIDPMAKFALCCAHAICSSSDKMRRTSARAANEGNTFSAFQYKMECSVCSSLALSDNTSAENRPRSAIKPGCIACSAKKRVMSEHGANELHPKQQITIPATNSFASC